MQCCSVLCAVPTQRYSRHEKRCWRSCMHRSTITRLPSGASISRSTPFRSGAFRCGVGTAHGCTRRFLRSSRAQRRRSRRPFGIGCAILSRMHAVWHRAEYRPSPSGTPSRSLPHPAESTPLGLLSRFASLRHAIGRVSRFPVAAHPRLTAAQSAAWSNVSPSGSTLRK
jgi:hypothetical protein